MATRSRKPGKGRSARKAPRKRAPRVKAWSVDAKGRWRDERGRFASGKRLLSFYGGTLDDASAALEITARNPKTSRAKGTYLVMARFEDAQIGDEGWRMLSHAVGLRTALEQAASWLDTGVASRPRGLYGYDPAIVDIELVSYDQLKARAKKAAATRKAKRAKRKRVKRK